jgi:hypothetical protein
VGKTLYSEFTLAANGIVLRVTSISKRSSRPPRVLRFGPVP